MEMQVQRPLQGQTQGNPPQGLKLQEKSPQGPLPNPHQGSQCYTPQGLQPPGSPLGAGVVCADTYGSAAGYPIPFNPCPFPRNPSGESVGLQSFPVRGLSFSSPLGQGLLHPSSPVMRSSPPEVPLGRGLLCGVSPGCLTRCSIPLNPFNSLGGAQPAGVPRVALHVAKQPWVASVHPGAPLVRGPLPLPIAALLNLVVVNNSLKLEETAPPWCVSRALALSRSMESSPPWFQSASQSHKPPIS